MNLDSKAARPAAADPLRSTLVQIPTVFGRLVYLSSLQNHTSGCYEHEQLSRVFGAQGADQTLRHQHRQVFSEWLDHSLEEQKADLAEYLAGFQAEMENVEDLEKVAPYRTFIPASAREVERQLYLTDLETLIGLIRCERGLESWG